MFCRLDVVQDLLRAGGSGQHAGHNAVAQHPSQRHLRQTLAALGRQIVQRPDLVEPLLRQSSFFQESAIGPDPAVRGDAFQIAIRQQALR